MEVKYIYNHSPCFTSLLKAKSLSTTALTSPKANAFFEILINYLFADTQNAQKTVITVAVAVKPTSRWFDDREI